LPAPQPIAGKPPTGEIATRQAYGEALVRLGESDARVRALDGDVKNSTFAEKFKERFPDRFVEGWIAEQNMVSVAAGLGAQGLIPFVSSFACFLERAADQIRMAGISRANVKLCGSHAGISIGEDGALADGAGGTCPCSAPSPRPSSSIPPTASPPTPPCSWRPRGRASSTSAPRAARRRASIARTKLRRRHPQDAGAGASAIGLAIVAAGITLHEALAAYDEMAKQGTAVRVIDLFCVKPLDAAALLEPRARVRTGS